ncbi:CLUMA_CG017140, isoform A [Clunio marinus]|uniref:CLUMA_CG017140, isoform A n=1 Tax=Clunio marinus TaxID=568069 RepID=A0A1J1IXZ4_9DIPT|nr:CLUMA_CG017140, isoform A [Clunio marinus]
MAFCDQLSRPDIILSGLMFAQLVLNVAAGKAPMQISTDGAGIPQKAIDGSTSSFFSAETCSLTKPERVPWWYVNLLEPYMVQLVRLDFGKSCCGNNKPATIVVRVGNNRPDLGTNPICNRFTGVLEEGQPLFLPCNPPMPGAFVSVHLEVNHPAALSICEAFVYTDQALPIERCPSFRDQPPGALASYNGKCYIFYNRQPMNLRDALAFCRSRGGTLINESNPALQGFISWELWRRHRSDISSQYWMGAVRDSKERNLWKWIGGEDVSVSFWNLPGGDEDCARYDGSKGWLWSDTNCNTQLNFICQHQPKACGRPEQPPNSTMITSKGFDVGYEMLGRAMLTCDIDERWNGPPPRCEIVECDALPANHKNSKILTPNGTIFGAKAEIQCARGFKINGPNFITCTATGQWSGPITACVEDVTLTTKAPTPSIPATTYTRTRTSQQPSRKSSTPIRTSSRFSTSTTQKSIPIHQIDLDDEEDNNDTDILPGTVREEFPPRKAVRPVISIPKNNQPQPTVTTTTRKIETTTRNVQEEIDAAHPEDNEVAGTNNNRHNHVPDVNVPTPVDNDETVNSSSTYGAKLNLSSIIALSSFGGFVFLAALITTIVILVRSTKSSLDTQQQPQNLLSNSTTLSKKYFENCKHDVKLSQDHLPSRWYTVLALPFPDQKLARRDISTFGRHGFYQSRAGFFSEPSPPNRSSTQHYRHRASPDCNTVASFDSSSSESRNGLNRYYRQAWENLHESASKNHNQLRRKETLDPPNLSRSRDNLENRARDLDRFFDRSRDNLSRGGTRDYGRDSLGLRDGSEMVVSDACVKGERKRHHHHHHHNKSNNRSSSELRDQNISSGNRSRHY